MNITRIDTDATKAVLKILIAKEDYEPNIQKSLKEYQRKIELKGFRKGMVPIGIVKKMYGKSMLVEEINKQLTDSLYKYISENKLKVLGEPLPEEKEQKQIDWDNDTEFEFCFELALAPDIEVKFAEEDLVDYYNIQIDDHLLNLYKESYASRFGHYSSIEISEGNELLKGKIVQLDKEGNHFENGIIFNDSSFYISAIKEEEIKNKFVGVKVGDIVIFNPKAAFPDKTDFSAILNIDKNQKISSEDVFEFTVQEISAWTNSLINQDLFDKIYGEGIVNSEEEFNEKIKEEINIHLSEDSELKFKIDIKEKLLSQINIELNNDLLKRWLSETDKIKLTKEKIEEEYPDFERDLRWQIIKDQIIASNELKASDEEILESVKEVLLMQYRKYGLKNVPEESLEKYAKEFMDNKEEKHKFMEKILEDKVYSFLKNSVNLNFIEISHDSFEELLKNH